MLFRSPLACSVAQEVDLILNKALSAVQGMSAFASVIQADRSEMERVFKVLPDTSPIVNLVYRLDSADQIIAHPDPDLLLRPAGDVIPHEFLFSVVGSGSPPKGNKAS